MRDVFTQCILDIGRSDSDLVFLTGDLGFSCFEELKAELRHRFINSGIAEQNMISVAAGLAINGLKPWVYSIAPFLYARPFEQIRNDICQQRLRVNLVGNGGGYAYGSMGASHHAIEDYGVLGALPNLDIYVPAFAADIEFQIRKMNKSDVSNYLRLGRCELQDQKNYPGYGPWRRLIDGAGPVLLCVGPLAGGILNRLIRMLPNERPELWVLSELNIVKNKPPGDFVKAIQKGLCVAEEHVAQGSVGMSLVNNLLENGLFCQRYKHIYARGYPTGTYGSQEFHRRENGLDYDSLLEVVHDMNSKGEAFNAQKKCK